MTTATPSPGSLASARERTWVVLPPLPDEPGIIQLRPVDSPAADPTGIYEPLEPNALKEAEYQPPDPERAGAFGTALLLRDAVRLRLRSGAGPFRSLGKLSVQPRPYQFVPLLMSLKLDPVRLLIADDVGVGKTIEAAMVARELLDRGIVRRIGVLCAPHLCEQWRDELRDKFHIEAAIIQSSRIAALERAVPPNTLLYRHYPHLVVSIDYAKSDKNRRAFLDNAPDLIIIDEAHSASRPRGEGAQQQRYDLARDLAAVPGRHVILCTATPHSGVDESFRSLLGLISPEFDAEGDLLRDDLAPHLVQRKRSDLEDWNGSKTPFPVRIADERTYLMSPAYQELFDDILRYLREYVDVADSPKQRQRVRYWGAIAILRSVLSSPAAARATLENRRKSAAADDAEPASEDEFQRQILDSADDDQPADFAPAAPLDDPAAALQDNDFRRLNGFLRDADKLAGPANDAKLAKAADVVSELLAEGFSPIVYCRFIATAKYVAEHLQVALERAHRGLVVRAVTGSDGDSEQRREIVDRLAESDVRVLVATDCLSEGVNLHQNYNAVIHYDLPWNPNRLEQREGRVDRFGQCRPEVKTFVLFGENNPVDRAVVSVLLRKATAIRKSLGVTVPVPVESDQVIDALVSNVLFQGSGGADQMRLGMDSEEVSRLHRAWDDMSAKEEQSRAFYAQRGIKPGDVARELDEMQPVLGVGDDVRRFLQNGLPRFRGLLRQTRRDGVFELRPGDLGEDGAIPSRVHFDDVPRPDAALIGRNHPLVAELADHVLADALERGGDAFPRSSAVITRAVDRRAAVLLLRLRYLIDDGVPQYAEEVVTAAFQNSAGAIQWIGGLDDEPLRLLEAADADIAGELTRQERVNHVKWALGMLAADSAWAEPIVDQRRAVLEASHARLRAQIGGSRVAIKPQPPDVIGVFVLVPKT